MSYTLNEIRLELRENCDAWIDWDCAKDLPDVQTNYRDEKIINVDGELTESQLVMLLQIVKQHARPRRD